MITAYTTFSRTAEKFTSEDADIERAQFRRAAWTSVMQSIGSPAAACIRHEYAHAHSGARTVIGHAYLARGRIIEAHRQRSLLDADSVY